MESVVLNGLFGQLRIGLSQQLIIDSYAVVGQSFSVTVVDTFADLQKFKIVVNSLLVLLDVVVKNSDRVVRSSLVSYFAGPSAPESQHFVVLQSAHHRYVCPVVDFFLGLHVLFVMSAVQKRCLLYDSGWCVEEERKLDSVGLGGSH